MRVGDNVALHKSVCLMGERKRWSKVLRRKEEEREFDRITREESAR